MFLPPHVTSSLACTHTQADLAWTGFTDLPCPLQLCGAGPHLCSAPLSSVLSLVLLCLELLPDPWKTNLHVPTAESLPWFLGESELPALDPHSPGPAPQLPLPPLQASI